ncbi:Plasmid stabilization system protein ParE [Pasteurella testudinis DSM 23072]|uniref:Plasmid stabilization system protein ParE n=1 Tax=Pasteurella testudinis DSM 23072 TaxID=1122938 RepID=A0A1W1VBL0_9PAST|nr:type II toxin-antitoxin system RelE/ParE family toxin [Pasteurella testudinis]SMB90580.1 Plasmid stabilization system protein ParE [Pasteurella testudinis DSM 23072]SUB52829.1 Plasmid stabilisation system protein [Pasteurella testudinis]
MLPEAYLIRYTVPVQKNLNDIAYHITEVAGINSAVAVTQDIQNTIALLEINPLMGKIGHISGTRELYPRGYRVVYQIDDNMITILSIIHCKQRYPKQA